MSGDKHGGVLALLLKGNDKHGARGAHTDHEDLSDEDLEAGRRDAGDALGMSDDDLDHHYTLHKLHAEKMRREES